MDEFSNGGFAYRYEIQEKGISQIFFNFKTSDGPVGQILVVFEHKV